jgi:hypothetical protein
VRNNNLKTLQEDYYGDHFRWFVGIVVNNKDPLKMGRVKVRIRGIHSPDVSQTPTNDLPWAQVVVPSTEGGISGIGKMPQLQQGSQVVGFFIDGISSQLPIVMGSLHHFERKKNATNNGNSKEDVPLDGEESTNVQDGESTDGRKIDSQDLPGGSNGEKIFNYLKKQGLTDEQAAGVIGNLTAESNLNPAALNPNDVGKPAFGLAQWRGSRYEDLIEFSNDNGLDYQTLEAQLPFMMHELETQSWLGYGALQNSTSVSDATRVFETKFERPRPGTFGKRFNYAQIAYDLYSSS